MPKLKLTIDRFEEDRAVLLADDGRFAVWPREWLPEGASEGQAIFLEPRLDPEEEAARRKLAQSMLKELLKTDEHG